MRFRYARARECCSVDFGRPTIEWDRDSRYAIVVMSIVVISFGEGEKGLCDQFKINSFNGLF